MADVISNSVASANGLLSITTAVATQNRCRGVYIGVAQDIDLSVDGATWVLIKNPAAGTILPIQAVGARKNAGSAAPDAGDIVFLY